MKDLSIVVLKGGTSAEREVSLWTAETIARTLGELGCSFVEIDAAETDWLDQVKQANPRTVLLALHGPFGEDGAVQEILEANRISYSGSDSTTSRLAINKHQTKELVHSLGIRAPGSYLISRDNISEAPAHFPVVVKPNRDGSSFGVTIVVWQQDLASALEEAFRYGDSVLVEDFVEGIELSCGVIDVYGSVQALPVIEIRPAETFFNFEAKYNPEKCEEICPAQIPTEIANIVQSQSVEIFSALGCKQYARIDWILRGSDPYFIEINTLPGMTQYSLLNKELSAANISYSSFIQKLIETA
jgi:D-alanine-D-alanine ligase